MSKSTVRPFGSEFLEDMPAPAAETWGASGTKTSTTVDNGDGTTQPDAGRSDGD
jgi:hypothetical protein